MTKGYKKPKKSKMPKVIKTKMEEDTYLDSPNSSTATTDTGLLYSYYGEEDVMSTNFSNGSCYQEDIENLAGKTLAEDMNFFDHLSDLPDIDNLSEEISASDSPSVKESASEHSSEKDRGQYVDPLAGQELEDHISSTYVVDYGSNIFTKDVIEEPSQAILIGDLLYDEVLQEDSAKSLHDMQEENTEDLFEALFELSAADAKEKPRVTDFEALAKEQEGKDVHQANLELIHELVQLVVEKVELNKYETALRQNIDKRKLLSELLHISQRYEEECRVSKLLNRKVVDFYKRRHFYHFIREETAKALPREKQKFLEAMKHLDEQLAKEKNVAASSSLAITRLRGEFEMLQQNVQDEILMFEDVVKRSLCGGEGTQLKTKIEVMLKRMAYYRQEVSDVRYQLIIKQHCLELLLQKRRYLEDLGNNLTLKDYEYVHNENQAFGKKIEELKNDLKKLHVQLLNNMHFMAHLQEKQSTIRDFIKSQSFILKDLLDEYMESRKYLYRLKLKRSHIRREIDQLNVQAGLLNKPALMFDYDQTVEYLTKQGPFVSALRTTAETILQRINKLEKRLTANNYNFSLVG